MPTRPEFTPTVPMGKPPEAIWPIAPMPDRSVTFPDTITEPETVAPILPESTPIKTEEIPT